MRLLYAWIWLALACPAMTAAQSATASLDALVKAYPEAILRHDGSAIYWRDGTRTPVSDGKSQKSFKALLRDASILDQFRLAYPRGRLTQPPAINDDPGRFRNEAFFHKLYGDCRKHEVRRHLVPLTWMPKSWGKKIYVTKVNGVATRLAAISAELDALPAAIKRAAYPVAGTYACRPVKDTGRPSMHSYAAAIDLNVARSDYWLWQKQPGPIRYRNRIPQEIVDIFERHGFIWGGKWYHYDTMHFEYRPELLGMSGKPRAGRGAINEGGACRSPRSPAGQISAIDLPQSHWNLWTSFE